MGPAPMSRIDARSSRRGISEAPLAHRARPLRGGSGGNGSPLRRRRLRCEPGASRLWPVLSGSLAALAHVGPPCVARSGFAGRATGDRRRREAAAKGGGGFRDKVSAGGRRRHGAAGGGPGGGG